MAAGAGPVPGPAGPDLLAGLRRAGEGRARVQRLVATGEVAAPIVIGRDHLDAGSVASPNRETEAMPDGSDAVADWPLLNALVNTAAGATWVSIHHGGGVGIGYSQHAGMVVVADGTELAAQKLERVLTTDPGMGVLRHVDAGYERAIEVARERGVRVPMLDGAWPRVVAATIYAGLAPGSAAPGASSSAGSGIVTICRTDDRATGRNASSPPIAPTQIVAWRPIRSPRMPPMIAPSGIVPQTMKRIVAFIRPCIRGGVIACRSEIWLMFQATPKKPPMKPNRASAGNR